MKNTAIIGAFALLASACASSGGYGRASSQNDYGYSETRIESDRYRVQYRLRGENVGRAQDLALLRASEITLTNGGDWFQVVNRSANVSDGNDRYEPGVSFGAERTITRECGLLGCRTRSTPTYTTGATFGSYDDQGNTVVNIEIKIGSGEKPASGGAYDASEIAANIRKRI